MPTTTQENAVRNVIWRAKGAATCAEDDIGMGEHDTALDHLRIARETIARAEAEVRKLIADSDAELEAAEAVERIGVE